MGEITPTSEIERRLASAKTPQETYKIEAEAAAAKAWAKEQNDYETLVKAALVYILAKRKTTELIEPEINQGGDKGANQYAQWQGNNVVTLADYGFTKMQWARRRKLLDASLDDINTYIDECIEMSIEPTTTGLMRFVTKLYAEEPDWDLPDGKYRVIYADPPWAYENTMPDYMGVQDDHYQTLTVKQLCEMPVMEIANEDAVLFLWVTSPILAESFELIDAWGFEYKTSFIWDKVDHVMGHYNSVRHEFLLVCVRGSCPLDNKKLYDSVVTEPRSDHSRKPEIFREIIDTIYPNGNRIELFARKQTEGWDVYGNEV
jgi:N6-adenosine-specific RNA methylase IME4